MNYKKILLINPPIRLTEKPSIFPPGLGYIAACLLKEGYDVNVLDINGNRYDEEMVERLLKKHLLEDNIDIVGIGCLITCYNSVKWLIQAIRKIKPETRIVVGGGLGTSIPEMCIEKLNADIVVLGEGELTIIDLLDAMERKRDLSEVKGIAFKKEEKIVRTLPRERIKNLDELPFPAWHLFPMDTYLKNMFGLEALMYFKGKSANVIGGKGCPFHCTFCYELFTHYAVKRSPQSIIAELKILKERYGVQLVYFIDDLFASNKEWMLEFCKLMKKEKLGIEWCCAGRVNLVDEEMLRAMKSAGCVLVNYGIESGSQKMLNIMKKGITPEQSSRAINAMRRVGLKLNLSFMIGFPEETKETIEETIKFCIDNDIHLTSIFFVTPYPGTALYEQAKGMGLIKDEEEYISRLGNATELTLNLTKWSDDDLLRLRDYVISTVHKAYYKKHKLEYILWLRKKLIWYLRYIEVKGVHAFFDEARKKAVKIFNR